ncbi:AraC-type DNA-binding protein [Dyella sp. OK004]|uniref:helix-turn-helix transcriptional regulator n=1 Tax=Dyella sp. OK004 TaxID=1855292 RepID=UPI0008E738EF|nr:helix-turn-helix transcriptional regulator [Dyella sp. OK004]SFR95127.1 AraC-type DNA-binding protein [Dyella sp. OK004]
MNNAEAGKARGVLRSKLEHGSFQHERRLPCPPLAWLIEHFWFVGWDLRGLPPQTQETLPHPNVHLVIEPPQARIYGVHSGRFTCELKEQGRTFGIKFKAGGFYPFLKSSVATLMDTSLAVPDVFGADAGSFEADVLAAADVDAMIALAERFLLDRLPPHDAMVERVSTIVASIADDRGITSVEQVCEQSGLGTRALQRLFQQYVGIGPKWVINRYRLHEAIAQLQEGRAVAWAELALELGYFDQAHFIRDFRKLVGRTPAEYARSEATP